MYLRRIIQHQTIIMDDHNRGSGESIKQKNLHLDKQCHGHGNKGISFKVDINTGKVTYDDKGDSEASRRIMNEIRRAFKKPDNLRNFADDVAEALKNWFQGDITVEKAQNYAENIAKAFNLKPSIKEEFVRRVGERLITYISIHEDELGKRYWILQKKEAIQIGSGDVRIHKGFDRVKNESINEEQ